MSIIVNLDKAKAIAHDLRRQQRAVAFAPLDQVITVRIPGTDPEVIEKQREAIREKYADIQIAINAAKTPDEIKAAIEEVIQ
jgi:hypothetical protein